MTRRFIVRARAERDLHPPSSGMNLSRAASVMNSCQQFVSGSRRSVTFPSQLQSYTATSGAPWFLASRTSSSTLCGRLWFRCSPSSISREILQSGHVGLVLRANYRSNGQAAGGSREFGVFAAARRSPRR